MTALTASPAAGQQTVISAHQLDVLVTAIFLGVAVVFVLVMAFALVSTLVGARGHARGRVRGGRR